MKDDVILQLIKEPLHRGAGAVDSDPGALGLARNVQCGDEIALDLQVEYGNITHATYRASACSICIASAEILCRYLEGKMVAEQQLSELQGLVLRELGIDEAHKRAPCALLPLDALKSAITADRI